MSDMIPDINLSQPSGAGAMLRQAREAQGMSIDILASIIKVPPAKLLALEAEDTHTLPNANFNRALAMTVCRALKVDSAPILARMPAAVVAPLASGKPPLNQPFKDFSHTGLTFEQEPRMSWRLPRIPPALMAPVLLFLLALLIYVLPEHVDMASWLPKSANAPQEAESAASGVEVLIPPVTSASDPEAGMPVTVTPASSAASDATMAGGPDLASAASDASLPKPVVVPASSPVTALPTSTTPLASGPTLASAASAAKPNGRASEAWPATSPASAAVSAAAQASAPASVPTGPQGTVTLSSKEPAWIEVRDASGQKLFSRQLAAGEQVDVKGVMPLKVHAGNAPAVSVRFNGQPVDLASVTRQNVARIELK